MKLLLDTHILLWIAGFDLVPAKLRLMLEDPANDLHFSVISLWEMVVKLAQGRSDFQVDPHKLRGELLQAGYTEVPVIAAHALAVEKLPPLHGDPFDRMLIAQASVEGATLVTRDGKVARYPGPIMRI